VWAQPMAPESFIQYITIHLSQLFSSFLWPIVPKIGVGQKQGKMLIGVVNRNPNPKLYKNKCFYIKTLFLILAKCWLGSTL